MADTAMPPDGLPASTGIGMICPGHLRRQSHGRSNVLNFEFHRREGSRLPGLLAQDIAFEDPHGLCDLTDRALIHVPRERPRDMRD